MRGIITYYSFENFVKLINIYVTDTIERVNKCSVVLYVIL
ncbi:hypothetical protein CNEO4_340079 [Clostridium neonatale]|nr:hypothetical protein CNEO4_340079 [Clostridium neonatale]